LKVICQSILLALLFRFPVDVPVSTKNPVPHAEGNAKVVVPHFALVVQVVYGFLQPENQVRVVMLHLVGISGDAGIDKSTQEPANSSGCGIQKTKPQKRKARQEVIEKFTLPALARSFDVVFQVFLAQHDTRMHQAVDNILHQATDQQCQKHGDDKHQHRLDYWINFQIAIRWSGILVVF